MTTDYPGPNEFETGPLGESGLGEPSRVNGTIALRTPVRYSDRMGPLEDALAEQKRRSEAMTRSATQAFQSTTQPDGEPEPVSPAVDADTE